MSFDDEWAEQLPKNNGGVHSHGFAIDNE